MSLSKGLDLKRAFAVAGALWMSSLFITIILSQVLDPKLNPVIQTILFLAILGVLVYFATAIYCSGSLLDKKVAYKLGIVLATIYFMADLFIVVPFIVQDLNLFIFDWETWLSLLWIWAVCVGSATGSLPFSKQSLPSSA